VLCLSEQKSHSETPGKDDLFFLDARRKFLENKPKAGKQSYAVGLRRHKMLMPQHRPQLY
jgi:hypothetical protein